MAHWPCHTDPGPGHKVAKKKTQKIQKLYKSENSSVTAALLQNKIWLSTTRKNKKNLFTKTKENHPSAKSGFGYNCTILPKIFTISKIFYNNQNIILAKLWRRKTEKTKYMHKNYCLIGQSMKNILMYYLWGWIKENPEKSAKHLWYTH